MSSSLVCDLAKSLKMLPNRNVCKVIFFFPQFRHRFLLIGTERKVVNERKEREKKVHTDTSVFCMIVI